MAVVLSASCWDHLGHWRVLLIWSAVSAVIRSTNTVRGWDLARLLQFQVWLDLCITHRSNTTNQQLAPRFRCDPCSMSSALPYSLCCNSPLNGNEHKDVRKLSFPIWKATQGPLLALCWGTVSLPDSFSRLVGVQSWDRSSKSPCPPPGWDEHLRAICGHRSRSGCGTRLSTPCSWGIQEWGQRV